MFSRDSAPDLDSILSPEMLRDEDAQPVFVVGSVRSGTSIMRQALHQGAGIEGYHEGNAVSLMQRMLDEVDRQFENMDPAVIKKGNMLLAQMDVDGLRNTIINYFVALYLKNSPKGRWLDKSPESYVSAPMIRATPRLLEVFPRARFVLCIRRGIEHILSRQRKFAKGKFEHFCRSWAGMVEAWGETREKLGDRYIEIHQHDIANRPAETARRLQEFLELGDKQRQGIEDMFTKKRFQQTRFVTDNRWMGLDETTWSNEEKKFFERVCGPMMRAAGYTLEAKVLDEAGPLGLFVPIEGSEGVIEMTNVRRGGLRSGADDALELMPNDAGEAAAEVRYLAAPMSGHSGFRSELEVAKGAGGSVTFGVRIERSDDREVVVAEQREVAPGERVEWSFDFDAVDGTHDIVIAVTSGAGFKSRNNAALWRRPRIVQA